MDTIPEDIINKAWAVYYILGITQVVMPPCDERIWPIVEAILAERQRCALLADKAVQPGIPGTGEWIAMGNFAAAIRDAILEPQVQP